ncbi:MAG: type II secretion system major pseudopilin GspG [Gemmatimonadales bacterium]
MLGTRLLRRRGGLGFTLIEILVVMVVIAVLAALVAPNVLSHVSEARGVAAHSQIEMIGGALDTYRLHNGRYPSTSEGLDALWSRPSGAGAPNWKGPYLRKPVPRDPWNNPYFYESPSESGVRGYDLLSFGADGHRGGEGEGRDIVSW